MTQAIILTLFACFHPSLCSLALNYRVVCLGETISLECDIEIVLTHRFIVRLQIGPCRNWTADITKQVAVRILM